MEKGGEKGKNLKEVHCVTVTLESGLSFTIFSQVAVLSFRIQTVATTTRPLQSDK